jgi:hypothetical protein
MAFTEARFLRHWAQCAHTGSPKNYTVIKHSDGAHIHTVQPLDEQSSPADLHGPVLMYTKLLIR